MRNPIVSPLMGKSILLFTQRTISSALVLGLFTFNEAISQNITKGLPFEEISPAIIQLSGKVIDKGTNTGLSYTNLKLKNKRFGSACNEMGNFLLDIDSASLNDTIQISRIGYKPQEIPVYYFIKSGIQTIILEEQPLIFPELTITATKKDWIYEFMEQVIDSIPVNYVDQPFLVNSNIYKKFRLDNNVLLSSKMSALIYYSSGYSATKSRDDKFVLKRSCYMEYDSVGKTWNTKEYKNEMYYALFGLFLRDFIAYNDHNFLNTKHLKDYVFDFENENRNQIIVRFKSISCKFGKVPFMNLQSFSGRIEINKNDYSITKIGALMVVDPKAMKKSLHTDAVGQIEIITEYKHNKEGKLFWYKSFYKQNFKQNVEIINENEFVSTGKQNIAESDLKVKDQDLCK